MNSAANNLLQVSESLKAIAHPDRISILVLLKKGSKKGISVSEICEKLERTQPEVSRHLSILKNKSILVSERSGVNVYYFINRGSVIFNCIESLIN